MKRDEQAERIAAITCEACKDFAWDRATMQPRALGAHWHHPSCPRAFPFDGQTRPGKQR